MDNKKRIIILIISVLVAVFISTLTPPKELDPAAMRFLGCFIAMLILMITRVTEDWVSSVLLLVALIATQVADLSTILKPLSGSTIWLILGVMCMAVAITTSGLIKRISLKVLTWFPSNYTGMVLAMFCSGMIISPLVSSTTGKGTLMAPIATTVSEQAGLKPGGRAALGIFVAAFFPSYIAGSAFLTGSANAAILIGMMPGFKISWMGWLTVSSVWLAVILICSFLFCVTYCKPEKGEIDEIAPGYFQERYLDLGPTTNNEKFAAIVLILALIGWVTQSSHGIDAGTVAMLATGAFGVYGLLTTKDFVSKGPWTLIIFLTAILSIASLITTTGCGAWIAAVLGPYLAPILTTPWIFIPVLCVIVFLMRQVIVSKLAVTAILLAIFGPLMDGAGMSVFVLLFVAYFSSDMWLQKFQASTALAPYVAAGEKYVPWEMFSKACYAYMAMSVIAMTASIPLWKMLGFIN